MTDRLTGLVTRKSFDERLRSQIGKSEDPEQDLSLIIADIDFFKGLNDRLGHSAGDAVIKWIAARITEEAGDGAVCARYGGEEFAVLLPNTEREQAFLLAESLRVSIERNRIFPNKDSHWEARVTISAGVAAFPTDGRSEGEILRKADQALYRAKKTGRNKVCIAQEEKMSTKTTHYTLTQLERLSKLAREENVGEAVLLREALDDLLIKYKVSDIES
jgi:diguanylate cyclase (GGDEF)-like protein